MAGEESANSIESSRVYSYRGDKVSPLQNIPYVPYCTILYHIVLMYHYVPFVPYVLMCHPWVSGSGCISGRVDSYNSVQGIITFYPIMNPYQGTLKL